jgi:hypothetical protein
MSTEITVYGASSLDDRMHYARTLASAGDLIPRGLWSSPGGGTLPAPSPGKVLMVMETGAMLGIHPVAALQGVNIIEGKPSISPALMSALIRDAGHTLRVATSGTIEGGDFAATATLTRSDDPDFTYTSTWTPHRAARAGLCTYTQANGVWKVTAESSKGAPKPWQSYSENMCKWRAIGEVAGEGAQDVIMGLHTHEEMGATVTDLGEIAAEQGEPEGSVEPTAEWSTLIRETDDKADLANLAERIRGIENGEQVRESEMTPALRDLIMTHVSTLTKDSREPVETPPDTPVDPNEEIAVEVTDEIPTESDPAEPSPEEYAELNEMDAALDGWTDGEASK